MTSKAALVLFSGGQDSTVCLAWALERYDHVETVGYAYGQRHAVELEQRQRILDVFQAGVFQAGVFQAGGETRGKLGDDHLLALMALAQISDTALTRDSEITYSENGLPTTFVPGRNLLFLTYAAALAYRRGISTLVAGMCETDFSGYPDCRNATIQTLASAISLGFDRPIKIETPLMFIDKADTWALAHKIGGQALIDLIVEDSHTCYLGDREHRHAWGYGCGACPACELRAKGWEMWRSAKA
jgi:7-cyano-7-deazaguanine synthase